MTGADRTWAVRYQPGNIESVDPKLLAGIAASVKDVAVYTSDGSSFQKQPSSPGNELSQKQSPPAQQQTKLWSWSESLISLYNPHPSRRRNCGDVGDASLTGVCQRAVRRVRRLHRSMLCTARHFHGSSLGITSANATSHY